MKRRTMNKWSHHLILMVSILFLGCKGTDQGATTSPAESKAVFTEYIKPLEGTWAGRIITYSDPRGQVDETPQPKAKDFTPKTIIARPTKTEQITSLTETFTNDGEFSQTQKVTEIVKGKQRYTSHGIVKVEDAVIINRLNTLQGAELSTGYKDEDGNFVWIKEKTNPKVLEYYKRIRTGDKIRVIGWGYYGKDDLSKAPRIWFLGDLKKT